MAILKSLSLAALMNSPIGFDNYNAIIFLVSQTIIPRGIFIWKQRLDLDQTVILQVISMLYHEINRRDDLYLFHRFPFFHANRKNEEIKRNGFSLQKTQTDLNQSRTLALN